MNPCPSVTSQACFQNATVIGSGTSDMRMPGGPVQVCWYCHHVMVWLALTFFFVFTLDLLGKLNSSANFGFYHLLAVFSAGTK